MKWKFISNSWIELNEETGCFSYFGELAHIVMHDTNKALREQGISIDLQGLEFYNKCFIKYIEAAQGVENKEYLKSLKNELSKI